jgi:hypothetical protein
MLIARAHTPTLYITVDINRNIANSHRNMQAHFLRTYKKSSAKSVVTTVFVYRISGTVPELESFRDNQGDFFREDTEGNPLWFTPRFVGDRADLLITSKGKLVPDTTEFDKTNSLVKQFGGNLGQAIADQFANKLSRESSPKVEPPSPPTPPIEDPMDDVDDDDDAEPKS